MPNAITGPTPGGAATAALGPAGGGSRAAAGGAAGLGSLVGGALGAAHNLLNFTTYYAMKSRAGTIGEKGLAEVITTRVARPGLRIHLVGHSFGARLVTAAAKAVPSDTATSLTLLQGAFSHYGFAKDWSPGHNGFFRTVVDQHTVTGPALVTHTANDRAVGIAYAIASRIAGQVAAGVGDANDIYGGIGRNGVQHTPEAQQRRLLPVADAYPAWQPRVFHNLLADEFVADHSDVTGEEVAYALLSAVAGTRG